MTTRKAIVFSFLDRYASLLLNIASSMVIARILSPSEIGIFSVTMVLLSFLSTIRDLGAGEYLVQEKNLTITRIQSVWAVQLGLGMSLAIIVLIAAFPVAVFYNEPKMTDIMLVIAANYAINPFGSLTYAYLMREMRFESIALIRFSGTVFGTAVSIYMAWLGFGPISLAYGMFSTTIVSAATSVYFRPNSFPWLPGTKEIGRVLSFGSKLTSTQFLNILSANAPELLLGKLQSMVAVGLYSRSSGLIGMFNRLIGEPINSVALSWFAKQKREHGNFAEAYLKATSYISVLGWSFSLYLILLAHPITRVLYGSQWDGSIEITRILAIGLIFTTPIYLSGIAQLAAGQANRLLAGGAISTLISVCFAAIGANFGLDMIALAVSLAAVVCAPLWAFLAKKSVNFEWKDLFRSLIDSALVSGISALGPLACLMVFGVTPDNNLLALFFSATGFIAGFIFGAVLINHPIKDEIGVVWKKLTAKLNFR